MTPRAFTLGSVFGISTALAGCLGGPPPPEPLNPVRFLLVSDLDANGATDSVGGIARLATVRKRIAGEGPVVFVGAGNVLPGASVATLNAAELKYATFGSDELTLPVDSLHAVIQASKFTWLSGNCEITGGRDTLRPANVRAWDTLRISTHKVGVFGLTFAGTYTTDSGGTGPAIRCSNPDNAARRLIDTLVAQGADLVVALTHQATENDRDLLLREARLDLILGGRDTSAQTIAIAGRHVLKSGPNAHRAQFVTLWGGKEKWRQAVGLVPIDGGLPLDSAVARARATGNTQNPD